MEPLTFELLRGSVIDLENVHMAREGRLPQRKAVEAGTDDHILVHATPNRHLQGVLGIPRTEDGPSITSVQLQGSVQERARILKALAPFPGGWAQSLEDDTQDGVSFCLRDETVSPRIVDEWQRSQASVRGAHQGGAESRKTCPFRCTPEAKAASRLSRLIRALAEKAGNVAESWDIETLRDEGDPTSAENDSSVITLIRPGNGKALLFTGDAGIPALTEAADTLDASGIGANVATFIQVPHHGSRRNVGPTILNRLVGPKLTQGAVLKTAFVSASKDGAPKHPARKVTNAFRRRGAPVHATQGTVKWHYSTDAPARPDYTTSAPLPLYPEVDE